MRHSCDPVSFLFPVGSILSLRSPIRAGARAHSSSPRRPRSQLYAAFWYYYVKHNYVILYIN